MKRKIRIFSHIAIICLSVCMFAFGVYAASTVSVTTSGTVTFNASGVYANVTRTVTGATTNPSNKEQTIDSSATEGGSYAMNDANESLTFANASAPIILSFEIENLATETDREFYVTVSEGSNLNLGDNVVAAVDYLNTPFSIVPGTSVTIDIMLFVKDLNKSVNNATYDYLITLTDNLGGDWYKLTENDVVFDEYTREEDGMYWIDEINADILNTKSKIIIPYDMNGKLIYATENSIFSRNLTGGKNTILTNYIIPNTIEYMEGGFEDGCTKLVSSYVMSTKSDFYYGDYSSTDSLKCITVANGIESLDNEIFNVSSLETLIIPANVSISSDCPTLPSSLTIFYKGTTQQWLNSDLGSTWESYGGTGYENGVMVYCLDGRFDVPAGDTLEG